MLKIKDFRSPQKLTIDQQEELEACLHKASQEGSIPCANALAIAKSLKIPVVVVGNTASKLDIKIERCLLGCF